MHPDVREIFHELQVHRDQIVRIREKDHQMSEALTQAALDLATASANLKAAVNDAVTFIQDVPGRIAQAIAGAANDADAVAAVEAVTADLKAETDVVVTALRTPPPAPAPAPAPAPEPAPVAAPDAPAA